MTKMHDYFKISFLNLVLKRTTLIRRRLRTSHSVKKEITRYLKQDPAVPVDSGNSVKKEMEKGSTLTLGRRGNRNALMTLTLRNCFFGYHR